MVPLKEHVEALRLADHRFNDEQQRANQRAIDAALLAQKEAVAAALESQKEAFASFRAATDKRFESVNEFRGTLSDNQATYLPREEYNAGRVTNGTSVRSTIAIGLTALGLVITLVVIAANAFIGK